MAQPTHLIKDKVAIVTGAASGIGAGVARLFASEGAHVYILDVQGKRANDLAGELRSEGASATAFEADVRNRDALARAVDDAISRFGRIDCLINNAGIYPRCSFLDMTEDIWDKMLAINLKGMFTLSKLVVPHMVERRAGWIVNISSITFFLGMENLTHYISTKGAIIGFTRSLAREMGQYNVHVNCITPGGIETEGEKVTLTAKDIDWMVGNQSLKRRITPLDIARACLFLCSELSDAMTGQIVNVDGGWTMH